MAVIVPNSEVRLIKNVPFSNNYRNVILFNSKEAQENYFKSLPSLIKDDFKYQRNNGTLMYPSDRDTVLQYNYLMFKNKAYSDKYFYAFITNVSYVNPSTCEISFELDVFQSWFLDVSFQPTYIERQHCRRWNSDGTPVINTVPESLEFGSEYITKSITGVNSAGKDDTSTTISSTVVRWCVLVVAVDGEIVWGESENQRWSDFSVFGNNVNEVMYFVSPIQVKVGSKNNLIDNLFQSDSVALRGVDGLGRILECFRYGSLLSKKLVSAYITDELPIDYSISFNSSNVLTITSNDLTVATLNVGENKFISLPSTIDLLRVDQLRSKQYFKTKQGVSVNKYSALKSGITESKLLMYPYSYNLLTNLSGDQFIIKNEYVSGSNINIKVLASLGTTQKTAYIIDNYLGNGNRSVAPVLDNGIIDASPNRLTTIDDYTAAYIQGNMNTIQQGIQATHDTTNLNNRIAQNNADTSSAITKVRNNANMNQAIVSGATGIIGGGIGDVFQGLNQGGYIGAGIGGGIAKGVGGIINAGIQNSANTKVTNLENANMIQNTALRGELANQQAIAGANAKVQDARNMADNVNLQGGNVDFMTGYGTKGAYLVAKQITPEYINILQNYFSRYGYAYHRMEVPNLKSRQSWNYIQTVGANIIGNIPQMFIDALEGLFNSGITLWHTTDVGNYNLANNEV